MFLDRLFRLRVCVVVVRLSRVVVVVRGWWERWIMEGEGDC